jgi:N-acetylmuramoyl-L-alanine amidase
MKTNVFFVICLLTVCRITAQPLTTTAEQYKARALKNLAYLSNDFEIRNRVVIDTRGIVIYTDHSRTTKDLVLYWHELPRFVDLVENADYYDLVNTFAQKGQQAFYNAGLRKNYGSPYKELPISFEGLKICLDPGHFASGLEEAHYEMRFAKFRAQDVGRTEDVQFYEADLAYGVALVLQQQIMARYPGAQVMITRPYATSALGKSFDDWYIQDFKRDLDHAMRKGDISTEQYSLLKDSATHKRIVFENFYKFLEFRKRAERINTFRPDITYVIHFNAKEGNRRFGDRYLMPTDENYNMVFVPGAFIAGELSKTDQKIDFIRLLLSSDLEKSIRLGDLLMRHHTTELGVPPIPAENDISVLRQASLITDAAGVYCRNLALTRMARGIVVYGESLYQDNKDELKRLAMKDYAVTVPKVGTIKIPSRCAQVAAAYLAALEEFIEQNKSMAQTARSTVKN